MEEEIVMKVNSAIFGVLVGSVVFTGCGSSSYDQSPGEAIFAAAQAHLQNAVGALQIDSISGSSSQTAASHTMSTGGAWFASVDPNGSSVASPGGFGFAGGAMVLSGILAPVGAGSWDGGSATLGFNLMATPTNSYDLTQAGAYSSITLQMATTLPTTGALIVRFWTDQSVTSGCNGWEYFGVSPGIARTGAVTDVKIGFADVPAMPSWTACPNLTFDATKVRNVRVLLDNSGAAGGNGTFNPFMLSISKVSLSN